MAKKRKSPNQDIGFEKITIDPRIDKSIFCKKMSIVTFLVMTEEGHTETCQFDVQYDAIKDDYQIGYSLVHKARFYSYMHLFNTGKRGVITVRTFLDEISHQHYTPEGRSVAIPFKEIRIFLSENGVIHSITPEEVFFSMVIDYQTQKPNWSNVDKSEIYCDEERSVPMETLKQQLAPIIEEECRG